MNKIKPNTKIRFFRYSGSKYNYTELVNELIQYSDNIDDTKSKIYVEPFVGSGAILFNLEKNFDKYVINDIDRNVINIYKTFKTIDYDYFTDRVNFIIEKFTTLKSEKTPRSGFGVKAKERLSPKGHQAKANFYNFRDWFNENHYGKNTPEEGIYCLLMANTVINSFLRFGPNGMNSSWGNRYLSLDEYNFNAVKERLQKTEIYNEDYKVLIDKYPDALFFLDPPYFSQDSSYSGFTEDEYIEFLEIIKGKEYIYTDILNDYNAGIQDKKLIREIVCTSPTPRKRKKGNMEYVFSPLLQKLKKMQRTLDHESFIDENDW